MVINVFFECATVETFLANHSVMVTRPLGLYDIRDGTLVLIVWVPVAHDGNMSTNFVIISRFLFGLAPFEHARKHKAR